jgi:hypothetical protein
MKILLSVLLLSLSSCAISQKVNGYITYSDIRKALSAKLPLSYDSSTGIFSAPINLSAYNNDANYLPLTKANTLFAPLVHTHSISNITNLQTSLNAKATSQQLTDSVAALNNKINFLISRMDSIATKATSYKDTMRMYVIVTAVKDSTQIPTH